METCNCHKQEATGGLPLAIVSIPMQPWEKPYDPATGLNRGTIFPGLDKPFYVLDAKGGANNA